MNRKYIPQVEKVLNRLFLPCVRYIRSLYIWGPVKGRDPLTDYNVKFLQECVGLTCLGLYFDGTGPEEAQAELQDTVISLMVRGKLTCLGFYSPDMVQGGIFHESHRVVSDLLEVIANSETARSRLKSLDLALWYKPSMTVDWILSKFPNLDSFTIRRFFRNFNSIDRWKPLVAPLRRLQLYNCKGVPARSIPDLVALFPTLRELTVVYLQNRYREPQSAHKAHPTGWHLLPNALCNTHQRLDWIHIDRLHLDELQPLGVIPTSTLIVTDIYPKGFVGWLESNPHVFPGMEVLWRETSVEYVGAEPAVTRATDALDEWCASRNVEVIEGAKSIIDHGLANAWWRLRGRER
ncbi:hypothetical protein CPB86DRAFT_490977 [Serendipita vermifera]|nr:hypothetical protein CPB86DRAFT_490977 [Serendipita vermifera]